MKVIQKLIHPNIIKHHKVFFSSLSVYVVMDYYPKGSVLDLITKLGEPLPLKKTKIWFAQILGAISYIHSKGMS